MQSVSEHPAVSKAAAHLAELRRRKRALEEEFEEARFGSSEPSVEEMAEEVYSGGQATATETRSAADVQRELKATGRAIQRARSELLRARNEAREEILEELRPQYRRTLQRMARLARKLLAAAEAELELEEGARASGLKPLSDPAFVRLPEGTLRDWLEKVEERHDV